MKQCLFFLNGFEADGGGSFTIQGSTAPSRGTLRFRLSYNVPDFGDLVISDGSQTIRLAGCRVVRRAVTGGGGGERWQEVTVEDRRWRWRYARIWGSYNTIEGNAILPRTKLHAQGLGMLLMQALGETRYDLSQLPTTSFPSFDWSADLVTGALEELLGQYGLILAPLYNGTWVAFKEGVGSKPSLDYRASDITQSREPQVVPDSIIFEGGTTLWQHDLYLEPVGIESMSEKAALKPIDSLSYKPAGGWTKEDPDYFSGVAAAKRELAKRCVWKYYRIAGPIQLTVPPSQLPNGGTGGRVSAQIANKAKAYYNVDIDKVWRILPLETKQLSLYKANGETDAPDAAIVGYFREDKHRWTNNAVAPASADDKSKLIDTSTNQALQYDGGFQVDTERGLVVFSEPIFYYKQTGKTSVERLPAKIRLRTSFGLKDTDSRAQLCQQFWFNPSPSSRQGVVDLVKRPEYVFEIADSKTTNVAEYIAQAQLSIAESLSTYYADDAISVPYKGFVFDQGLSGAIRAITWSVSNGAGTTSVDYLNDRGDLRASVRDLREKALTVATVRTQLQARRQAAIAARKSNRRPVQ